MQKYKIIIDTNLWISLLIGKRLSEMQMLCNSERVDVYICDELTEEFMRIASREKIRKYATVERVMKTLDLMKTSCILSFVRKSVMPADLRDANDMYLLSLAETVQADFILTGDKDLLTLQSYHQTKIVTYSKFIAEHLVKD